MPLSVRAHCFSEVPPKYQRTHGDVWLGLFVVTSKVFDRLRYRLGSLVQLDAQHRARKDTLQNFQ